MANKRKSIGSPSEKLSYSKRSRVSNDSDISPHGATVQPRVDPTYGQRGAFPGLDGDDGEEAIFYGPASDGLEYLRMVRSEAKTVPNLLVAPTSPISEDATLYADYAQGYYADGAYLAAPAPPLRPLNDDEVEDVDPQEAYYTALHERFSHLATTLHSPSPAAVATTQSFSSATRGTWRSKILYSQPTMALLSQMPQETVMRGLNFLEKLLTTKNLAKSKDLGAWAWGLLARCRPVGEMGSEEVGILRSLGKRAVWVLRGMIAGRVDEAMADEEVEVDMDAELEGEGMAELGEMRPEGSFDEEGQVEEQEPFPSTQDRPGFLDSTGADALHELSPALDALGASSTNPSGIPPGQSEPNENMSNDGLLQARQRLLSSLPPSSPTIASAISIDGISDVPRGDPPPTAREAEPYMEKVDAGHVDTQAIHATLDVIITIVGEFYGQRDLLDGRLLWDEMSS